MKIKNFTIEKLSTKILLIIILTTLIMLSSCTSQNIPGENNNAKLSSGIFTLNFQLENLQKSGNINYKISLKNGLKNSITITKSNIKFTDIYQDKNTFVNNLDTTIKKNIFQSTNKIILPPDESFIKWGNLKINKNYLNNPLNTELKIRTDLTINYKTNFSINVVINKNNYLQNGGSPLKVENSLNIDGPLKISNIKSYLDENNQLELKIFFKKDTSGTITGLVNDDDKTPQGINIYLGTQKLNCQWETTTQQLTFNIFNSNTYLDCKANLQNNANTNSLNTLLQGELNYNYLISKITTYKILK